MKILCLLDTQEARYAKLLLGDTTQIQDIIKTEQTALQTQLADEPDDNVCEKVYS